jgi:hypothetical protein
MSLLTQIWKERSKIMEGIKNSIIHDEFVENIASLRNEVCLECPSRGDKCAIPGTAPCCNECGCSLGFKTRSLSSVCPLGKWKALLTEEEVEKLENELDNPKN